MAPPPGYQPELKAAKPRFGDNFDPWNSSSSGHQRADNTPGTGWRDSRTSKLNSQFNAGGTGGERLSDTYGNGSEDWDESHQARIPKSVRERAGRSVLDMLGKPGTMKESLRPPRDQSPTATKEEVYMEARRETDEAKEASKGIFDGVVVYVNGSTYPLISDHKLKHILSENGASLSLHLGRRKVTHVIVGRPCSSAQGAGGGLAGGKLEKEIRRIGGSGVKFVGAEW